MRAFAIAVFLSCAPVWSYACDDASLNALKSLRNSDPVASAQRAVKSGDVRFLSVRDYSEFVPGVKNQACALEVPRPRLIDPTGDLICTKEHGRLKDVARRYAERYNREVQKILTVQGNRRCES
jgi:hypothetical protein